MLALEDLKFSHDLRLPAWGPYTKKYAGISHIPDVDLGIRFDLGVFPGFYRRQVSVPNAKWESGYHPWEAAPGLSYYSYRYELEWKDQVYCDVSFSALGDDARLIRCEFVNNTDLDQNLVLHYMAYLNFPPVRPYSDEPIRPSRVILPDDALWLDAIDYDDLGFAISRPSDNLVYEGWRRAEVRGHGFVGGAAVGMGFGADRRRLDRTHSPAGASRAWFGLARALSRAAWPRRIHCWKGWRMRGSICPPAPTCACRLCRWAICLRVITRCG